jgi:hypothetical protein
MLLVLSFEFLGSNSTSSLNLKFHVSDFLCLCFTFQLGKFFGFHFLSFEFLGFKFLGFKFLHFKVISSLVLSFFTL